MADITVKSIFNRKAIEQRAQENWDFKNQRSRTSCGRKYNHIFVKHKMTMNPWENDFYGLSPSQQKLLLKSEIIRTYDALPNSDKSKIKFSLGLSTFASKWYKLPSEDKKKILKVIINTN